MDVIGHVHRLRTVCDTSRPNLVGLGIGSKKHKNYEKASNSSGGNQGLRKIDAMLSQTKEMTETLFH